MIRFVLQLLLAVGFSLGAMALTGLALYGLVALVIGTSVGLILFYSRISWHAPLMSYLSAFGASIFIGACWPALPLILIYGAVTKRVVPDITASGPSADGDPSHRRDGAA